MERKDLEAIFEGKYSELMEAAQYIKAQSSCIDTKHIIDDMLDKTEETVAFRGMCMTNRKPRRYQITTRRGM